MLFEGVAFARRRQKSWAFVLTCATDPGEQKDFEVYSCHVSADGKRLATAGGDGHVRIWSTESIYHANDPTYTKPRQLCHMSHHLGTIHSVRFSPNGRYLASGADDKIICVYYLDKSPATIMFGMLAMTLELGTGRELTICFHRV
jgi:WD40 repeat protein